MGEWVKADDVGAIRGCDGGEMDHGTFMRAPSPPRPHLRLTEQTVCCLTYGFSQVFPWRYVPP